jgi:hypothetical protein
MNNKNELCTDPFSDLMDEFNKAVDQELSENKIDNAEKFNNNLPEEQEKEIGFVCLGYNDSQNYVWSNFKNCLFVLSPKDLSKNYLINCFGSRFLNNNYTEVIGNGRFAKVDVNYEKLANDIINGCQKAGIYSPDKQKGKGVWLNQNGHLVINSDEVFSTDPKFNNSRIQKDATYIYKGSLGITAKSPEATLEDRKQLLQLLDTFKFANKPTETNLMLGFIGQGFTTGAWEWIAHAYTFGEAGSGKSTILKMLRDLWGSNGFYTDGGSSEAGIRQKIGNNTLVVQIDETEPDRKKVDGHLGMFRGASSGTTVLKGTTDQSGTEFTLKFAGLLAGVIPVELRQADKGRFLQFKLLPLNDEDKKKISKDMKLLMNNAEKLTELGKKIQMYIINRFHEIDKVRKEVRDLIILNNSARLADTYSTVIALSYMLQKGFHIKNDNNEEITIEDFLSLFDIDEKSKELSEAKDHDEMFELLMTREISNGDNKDKMSIINYIYNAHYSYKNSKSHEFKEYNSILGKYGIRVLDSINLELLIDPTRQGLKELLAKSRFESGNIKEVLLRLSGVEIIYEPKMVGGVQKRNCVKVALNQDKFNYKKYEELRDEQPMFQTK